jgi:hypothetical protein
MVTTRPRLTLRLRRAFRVLTPDGFALAPLWVQLAAIFSASALLILASSLLIGSISLSYRLFSDPSSYADMEGFRQLFFGFFQVGFGLILFSFIISVLSAALEQLIERIRGGTRPYRNRGHLLIVNRNPRLVLMLDQINERYSRQDLDVDIVLLLSDRAEVEAFCDGLDLGRWPLLHIFVRQGDLQDFETYRRVSISAASGIVLLAPEGAETAFGSDNINLKILTTLVDNPPFWRHIADHQEGQRPIKCTVELSGELQSRAIARTLTAHGREALFSIATPGDVIGRVLSRSVIDETYHRIYFEIFSAFGHSIHFIDSRRFAAQGAVAGTRFEDLCRNFTRGVLIGWSCLDQGEFKMQIAPFGQVLATGDWLLFVALSADAVTYEPTASQPVDTSKITQPSEISRRKLCVIGNAHQFERLGDFLHPESRAGLKESTIVFDQAEDYFEMAVIDRVRNGNFDSIIINLDDETAFRFVLFLFAQFKPDDPMLEKVVTVLIDPVIERLLNRNSRYRNTVLPDKLAANYITQLSFQKNLEKVYYELSDSEGVEFNLLEVGRHIPRALLTTKAAVKDLLLASGMVYVGAVDPQKNVSFDADSFTDARQLVVISLGDSRPSTAQIQNPDETTRQTATPH